MTEAIDKTTKILEKLQGLTDYQQQQVLDVIEFLQSKISSVEFKHPDETPISTNKQASIIRTERGLTIAGTRISVYDVMDFLKAEYPPKLIKEKFNLTQVQMNAVLTYIESNKTQVEVEYQEVLQNREEIRQYWEEHNCDRLARIATTPHKPGQESLWAKLEEQKAGHTSEN